MATGTEASREELDRLLRGIKTNSARYGGQNLYGEDELNELSRAAGWAADILLDVMEHGIEALRGEGVSPSVAFWKRLENRFYRHRAENEQPEPQARKW